MGDIKTSGYIAELSGFITGISVSLPVALTVGQGLHFQIYRDAMETPLHFYITDGDNFTNADTTDGGAKRTRLFCTIPSTIIQGESEQQTFHFKAGERIAVLKKAMDLYGYTDASVKYIQLQVHRVYDIINEETINALGIAGGKIGNTPGSGGGGGGGGEPPPPDPEEGEIGT
jgi:hypothetical protein